MIDGFHPRVGLTIVLADDGYFTVSLGAQA